MKLQNIAIKIRRAQKKGGAKLVAKRALRKSYTFFRPIMPVIKKVKYNGVIIRKNRLFESILDYSKEDKENFEKRNIDAINKYAQPNDNIAILGGGFGVTAYYAHSIIERGEGSVIAIEASKSQMKKLEKIKEWNSLDELDLKHGVVGEPNDIYGSMNGAEQIKFNEIKADLIQMDIEGSECEILKNMISGPKILIVESHGNKGCPSSTIKKIMRTKGYKIDDFGPERDEERFIENDVKIIVGKKYEDA